MVCYYNNSKRMVDSYSKNVIREAKYGYQSLSKFIQNEINKDVWILNNTSVKVLNGIFIGVKFHKPVVHPVRCYKN